MSQNTATECETCLFLKNIDGDMKPNFQDAVHFWKVYHYLLIRNLVIFSS